MTLDGLIEFYRPYLADETVAVGRRWEDTFKYALKHCRGDTHWRPSIWVNWQRSLSPTASIRNSWTAMSDAGETCRTEPKRYKILPRSTAFIQNNRRL